MSFDMDFSQELKSLLEIGEDVFSNMSDDTSTTDLRFSKTFSNHDLEKQRNERIPKKTRQNNMFSMNVWRAWANSRNSKQETLLEKFKTVPVVLDATTKEELSFWMCRFVNEARRKDVKYIYFLHMSRTLLESFVYVIYPS